MENYKPSAEEIDKAEEMMTDREKHLSEKKERMEQEINTLINQEQDDLSSFAEKAKKGVSAQPTSKYVDRQIEASLYDQSVRYNEWFFKKISSIPPRERPTYTGRGFSDNYDFGFVDSREYLEKTWKNTISSEAYNKLQDLFDASKKDRFDVSIIPNELRPSSKTPKSNLYKTELIEFSDCWISPGQNEIQKGTELDFYTNKEIEIEHRTREINVIKKMTNEEQEKWLERLQNDFKSDRHHEVRFEELHSYFQYKNAASLIEQAEGAKAVLTCPLPWGFFKRNEKRAWSAIGWSEDTHTMSGGGVSTNLQKGERCVKVKNDVIIPIDKDEIKLIYEKFQGAIPPYELSPVFTIVDEDENIDK
jgi:hypothetical protein